jgi:hypothetical protein
MPRTGATATASTPRTSVKRIADNVLFGQFAIGIQAYTGGGNIDNIQLEGNVAFDNGVLSRTSGYTYNLLIGGMQVANNPSMTSNFTYSPQTGDNDLGYNAGCTNATVTGNYFAGYSAIKIVNCLTGLSMSGNTFYGLISGSIASSFPSNTYLSTRPSANQVFIRPNLYEPGRAHVIVYNWNLDATVDVDASSVLAPEDLYEIRSVQNVFGTPVLSGTYSGGPITIPLSGLVASSPVGVSLPAATRSEFNVFLLRRTAPPREKPPLRDRTPLTQIDP